MIPPSRIHELQEAVKKEITSGSEQGQAQESLEAGEVEWDPQPSLLNQFLTTFLPGGKLRRHQQELWAIFESMCESQEELSYRGIVQWPTGTGKTFALLMLLLLSADRCKRNGRIFRGLLVAPKNDIFNTIMAHIRKLKDFGIEIYEGHNAQLSGLDLPTDKPFLLTATHAALTNEDLVKKLPPLTHIHYDEVHRIGGEEFFQLLTTYSPIWRPEFLTGTSATPKTANPAQHRKLAELFGDPFTLLHKVSIEEAVQEGWIAQPRFHINICSKNLSREQILNLFLYAVYKKILEKGVGKKYIVYLPTRSEVNRILELADANLPPHWKFYTAVTSQSLLAKPDAEFVTDPVDDTPRILFACERYREGSDIQGLEMTAVLMGDTISSNIALQIMGRGLRADYPNKEGWCLLFRPSEEGTTEEEVLDMILLEIMETMTSTKISTDTKEATKFIETCIGSTTVKNHSLTVKETVERIQALFDRRHNRVTYEGIKAKVRAAEIHTQDEYMEKKVQKAWPDDPTTLPGWRSWYDFLQAAEDETRFTLSDFTTHLFNTGIYDKGEYERHTELPSWDSLLTGFLTDYPCPLPSFLEETLFGCRR
jgi:superfamily II DNA or RNA helicase